MSDTIFTEGMIVKPPHEKAPEFVKANVSIKVDEFITFLENHAKPDGWVNIQIKEGRTGKWYSALDQWTKETPKREAERSSDEDIASAIPF